MDLMVMIVLMGVAVMENAEKRDANVKMDTLDMIATFYPPPSNAFNRLREFHSTYKNVFKLVLLIVYSHYYYCYRYLVLFFSINSVGKVGNRLKSICFSGAVSAKGSFSTG